MVDMSKLIGEARRFGIVGPLYEIAGWSLRSGDRRSDARIRLIDSGEELDYPVVALLADPVEV